MSGRATSLAALLVAALVAGLFAACTTPSTRGASTAVSCEDQSAAALVERARRASEEWVQLVPFEESGLAILSFPGAEGELSERTFLYDQALALLWYAAQGDLARARGLADTLVALQMENGAWGFSFEARPGGFYDEGYVRSGAVAWAGWALASYGAEYDDEAALEAARRAKRFLIAQRLEEEQGFGGLFGAGVGYHDPATGERTLGVPVEFVSTEHQFDAHMLLAALEPMEAAALQEQILSRLWMEEERRFALGANDQGLDRRRALDTSGGWGALWLLSVGEQKRARSSLLYTLEHFPATGAGVFGGFVPYLDVVDGLEPSEDLIFVEGSLGVALAALRLGEKRVAKEVLTMAARQSCEAGGAGVPYANRGEENFPAIAAAAPTLWFLMVERELTTGNHAPVFLLSSPEASEETGEL